MTGEYDFDRTAELPVLDAATLETANAPAGGAVAIRALEQRVVELVAENDRLRGELAAGAARIARQEAALGEARAALGRLPLRAAGPASSAVPVPAGATRLLVHKDGNSEIVHVLGRRTTIGRTADNDLQLDTRFISRHHAVILCGPVHTVVEDLRSTNGVLVNDQRVTRHTLQDGDAVTIGRSLFRFVVRLG